MTEILVVGNPLPKRNRKGQFVKRTHARRNPARRQTRRARRNPSGPKARLVRDYGGYRGLQATGRVNRSRRRRRYRRNPVGGFVGDLVSAGIGAGGVLGVDVLIAALTKNRPDIQLKLSGGFVRPAIQGAAAVGLGLLASAMKQRRAGEAIMAGGLSIAMYSLGKSLATRVLPNVALGDAAEYSAMGFPTAAMPLEYDAVSEFIPNTTDPMLAGGELSEFIGEDEETYE